MIESVDRKKSIVSIMLGLTAILYAMSLHWVFSEVFLISFTMELILLSTCLALYVVAILLNYRTTRLSGARIPWTEKILPLCASGVAPSIMLFHYFSLNAENFSFLDFALLGTVYCFISITLYLLLSIKGDTLLSMGPILLAWFLFWIYPYVITRYPSIAVFWILVIIIEGVLVYSAYQFHMDRLTGKMLAGVVCTLFLFNLCSAGVQTIRLVNSSDKPYTAKTTFKIDDGANHPDIYWFHMDGMMGFDTIDSILGDNQYELRNELANLGFQINGDASLDIGWTSYAIPALTSPTIYESYLKPIMDNYQGMTDYERRQQIQSSFSIYDSYSDLELFSAFDQAGYGVYHVLNDIGRSFENIPIKYSETSDFQLSSKGNMIELLEKYSVLSCFERQLRDIASIHSNLANTDAVYDERIFDYVSKTSDITIYYIEHYDWYLSDIFEETLGYQTPRLVYIQNFLPHFPFRYDEDGILKEAKYDHDMSLYLSQHSYAVRMMVGMIERVIEENPDAVIVVQGDHGVHYFERDELAEQGFTGDQMLEMNYSTISAVRIPEKYGALTEPLDPLDITRFLVNHYVGRDNYGYLYYHEEE